MIAFFYILNKEEFLEEILEIFLEMNIPGATVVDSIGMGSILAKEIPIFAGFKNLFQGTRSANKTIFTIMPEELVEPVVKALEQVIGPLNKPGAGLVFTLPVHSVYGLQKSF